MDVQPLPLNLPFLGPAAHAAAADVVRAPSEFLVDPSNSLLEPAVRSVLAAAPPIYNPLLFYGSTGSGKTHLARGLAGAVKEAHRRGVIYTTAIDFAKQWDDAVSTHAADEFHRRFRQARLLVIEDLDELPPGSPACEELVATVDALLNAPGQVIFTSTLPPGRLAMLCAPLQSRLAAGLVLPILPPGIATRRQLLVRVDPTLGEPLIALLAGQTQGPAGELIALVRALRAEAAEQGHPADLAMARRVLEQSRVQTGEAVAEIAALTAKHFGIKVADLRGQSRRRAVVQARGVAMYLARQHTRASLKELGEYFGGRDHTTVLHGCRKIEELIPAEPGVQMALARLEEALRG